MKTLVLVLLALGFCLYVESASAEAPPTGFIPPVVSDPKAPDMKKCCVAMYQKIECAGKGGWSCASTDGCAWTGKKCIEIFKEDCTQKLKACKGEAELLFTHDVKKGYLTDPEKKKIEKFIEKNNCDYADVAYCGHGSPRHCQLPFDSVAVCLQAGASKCNFDTSACKFFQDHEKAEQYSAEVCVKIREHNPKATCTLSANACSNQLEFKWTGKDLECKEGGPTRNIYEIKVDGISVTYPKCHKWKEDDCLSAQSGEEQFCIGKDKDGESTIEREYCKCDLFGCEWYQAD